MHRPLPLLVWYFNLPVADTVNDVMRRLTVNGAANGLGSSENFEHGALELLSKTLGAHRPCDLNDLVEGDVAGVLDVLLLLPVTRGLLESANDE